MSSCYIGPFGRILPTMQDVLEAADCKMGDPPNRSSQVPSTHQFSSPKRPVCLEFGTDTALKPTTPPERLEAMLSPDPPSPVKGDESCELGLLPLETQLLTPSSPSSLPSSPHFPRARLSFSTSPNITSAQLFSPVDGSVSETQALPVENGHDFTKDLATTLSTTVAAPMISDPVGSLYEEYYGQVGGDPSNLGLTSQWPPFQETRPFTPPDMDYPISRYHQGQLPYHPNLLNTVETPPSSNLSNTSGDIRPQPAHPLLPCVIDEQIVEGEGLCYIYSDGSYCPKLIDGEPVNANWGVTKAGKPRKRLAQACITCREKKIKCHPNLPKCDQCQKSGRTCRFESAPRGNQTSAKKSQSLRKARSCPKNGLVANSPNHQYPPRIATNSTSINGSNTSCPGRMRYSKSPTSLSLFSNSSADGILPSTDGFPELGRPPKRRR